MTCTAHSPTGKVNVEKGNVCWQHCHLTLLSTILNLYNCVNNCQNHSSRDSSQDRMAHGYRGKTSTNIPDGAATQVGPVSRSITM